MLPELRKLCRTCLAPDKDLISIFEEEEPNNDSFRCAADIIGNLTNMPTKSDGLPELVCLSCSNEIKKIHCFAMKCINSECILRKILEDKGEIMLSNDNNAVIAIDKISDQSLACGEENTRRTSSVPSDFLIIKSEEPSCSFFVEHLANEKQINTDTNEENKTQILEPSLYDQYNEHYVSEVKPELRDASTNGNEALSPEALQQLEKEEISKLKCPKCHKSFKYLARLKKHIKNEKCLGEPIFTCSICGKKYNRPFSLQRHCLISHNQKLTKEIITKRTESSEGTKLDKTKEAENELKIKVKQPINNEIISIEAMRQCNYCKEVFENDEALALHKSLEKHKKIQPTEKTHVCELCGKAFNYSHNLKIHLMSHNEIKPFKCELCDQRFVRNSCLNRHLKSHSGHRPFTCEFCGKGFRFMHALRIHERSHTEERPYSCTLCSVRFKFPSGLKEHHRTHTGEKPYACKFCPRKLSSKNNLRVHMKSHEKNHETSVGF